jgi:hypothetical protein
MDMAEAESLNKESDSFVGCHKFVVFWGKIKQAITDETAIYS